jgi:hypothetical protein
MKNTATVIILFLSFIFNNLFAQDLHAKFLRKKFEQNLKVRPSQIDSFVVIQTQYENSLREISLAHRMKQSEKEKQITKLIHARNIRLQKNTLTVQQYNEVIKQIESLKIK